MFHDSQWLKAVRVSGCCINERDSHFISMLFVWLQIVYSKHVTSIHMRTHTIHTSNTNMTSCHFVCALYIYSYEAKIYLLHFHFLF